MIEYLTIFGVPYAFGIALVMLGARGTGIRPGRVEFSVRVMSPREAVVPRNLHEGSRQDTASTNMDTKFVPSDRNDTLSGARTSLQFLLKASLVAIIPGVLLGSCNSALRNSARLGNFNCAE